MTQEKGPHIIETFQKTLPNKPGVYRMLDEKGRALYIGKAKKLAKRVAYYTRPERLNERLRAMVEQTASMEMMTTKNEAEALLMEASLIKSLKPKYNILLRDDKSFPYIMIRHDHSYPQILKHRGQKKQKGHYFGPFPSAGSVNETIATLQKIFLLRSCTDHYFETRKRPCLLYQIKRCSAPCVGHIQEEAYAKLVAQATDFLSGKSIEVKRAITEQMEEASTTMDYEKAAILRDRIKALEHIRSRQHLVDHLQDADVVALAQGPRQSCIQLFVFRGGQHYGNRSYFPQHVEGEEPDTILEAFLGQYYSSHEAPKEIVVNHPLADLETMCEALSQRAGRKVVVLHPKRGDKKRVMMMAEENAKEALDVKHSAFESRREVLQELADTFYMGKPPSRIEIYDNSHIMGKQAIGAMVVADPYGFCTDQYRKFSIDAGAFSPTGGDDYGMLRETLTRRLSKLKKDNLSPGDEYWPDLLLIDGGPGHLTVAREVLADSSLSGIHIACIAKGKDRNAGKERFFLPDVPPFTLDPNSALMHFLQNLRDEAHRFAIQSHRHKRAKAQTHSLLDDVPGIGLKRKKALIQHFGSPKAVFEASLEELLDVPGIDKKTAETLRNINKNNRLS